MKPVNKEVFNELRKLGKIKEDKNNKNFSITSKNKNGKRKKYYVLDKIVDEYFRIVGHL